VCGLSVAGVDCRRAALTRVAATSIGIGWHHLPKIQGAAPAIASSVGLGAQAGSAWADAARYRLPVIREDLDNQNGGTAMRA
jgi:hypothetical protein